MSEVQTKVFKTRIRGTNRLEPSGSFNGMVSHRVRLHGPVEVDAELIEWLRNAYERA